MSKNFIFCLLVSLLIIFIIFKIFVILFGEIIGGVIFLTSINIFSFISFQKLLDKFEN